MSIDYAQLIDKLGTKLNSVGEAAFKIGVAGAKFEAIGEFTAFTVATTTLAVLAYASYRKGLNRELSYDQRGFFDAAAIVLAITSLLTSIAVVARIPSLLIALNQPEYLFLRNVIKAVK